MKPLLLAIVLIAAALLSGCGDCLRCEREMDRARTELGEPEATEQRRDGNIVTETWFYYEQNRSQVFLWDDRDCSCSVNTYLFEDGVAEALHFETVGGDFFKP